MMKAVAAETKNLGLSLYGRFRICGASKDLKSAY